MHRLQELVRLHRLGTPVREVARLLQMGPGTERRYRRALRQAQLLDGDPHQLPELQDILRATDSLHPVLDPPAHERSTVEPYREVVELMFRKGLRARAIFDRLRLEHGDDFQTSYDAMKRFVRRLQMEQGVLPEQVAIPVLTEPGDVAQVDFGYAGKLFDPESGVLRKAWVFVMTLAHSRHMFAKVVFDQRSETWLRLHVEAFRFFGGVPKTLVPDNLKAAVVRAAFGLTDSPGLNRSYRDLARHYGFKIDPTPPRSPQKKGKVESSVRYVKRNALVGRHGEDLHEVNSFLRTWTLQVAGLRTHGVTQQRPLEVFESVEQECLLALPHHPYQPTLWKQATVHQDAHVVFRRRLYSVPWRWIGKKVWIRARASEVAIYSEDTCLARHALLTRGTHSTHESHLPAGRRDLRHRGRDFWMERAQRIGPETAAYVDEVFDADAVLSQLRTVQAIVTHLEGFPKERAEAAAKRARFFGTYDYRGLKAILAKALDLQPLPQVPLPLPETESPPRFARSAHELLAALTEVVDESH